MKVSVKELPPLTIVSMRVALAALLLSIFLKIQKKKLWPYKKHIKHFLVMGISACALPFFLITYSEKTISSGLAGLINGSVPIFAATMSHFFLPNDRLSIQKSLGIVMGVIGLTFVFIPSLHEGVGNALGIMMVIISSLAYAFGMVYSKKYLQGLPPLIAPTWQLLMATFLSLPLCLIIEKPYALPMPSVQTLGAVIGLAFIGSACAFILYYRLIEIAGASYLSLCTLLFPLIAVTLGAVFLEEQLTWNSYIGGAIILSGLVLGTELIKWKRKYEMA